MEKKTKEVKSKGLVVSYDNRINELFFVSGEKLCFNSDHKTFEIDQDPYGESDLQPITGLSFDTSSFEFYTVTDGADYHYKITGKYPADQALYAFLKENDFNTLSFPNNDQDVILVEFEKQKLVRIKLIKLENETSSDFLTIYFEPKENFLIKYPQQRRALNGFGFRGNQLVCQIPGEELIWELTVHPTVLALVQRILATYTSGQ